MDGVLPIAGIYGALSAFCHYFPSFPIAETTRGRVAFGIVLMIAGFMQIWQARAVAAAASEGIPRGALVLLAVGTIRLLASALFFIPRTSRAMGYLTCLVMTVGIGSDAVEILRAGRGLEAFGIVINEGKSILMRATLMFWVFYFVIRPASDGTEPLPEQPPNGGDEPSPTV